MALVVMSFIRHLQAMYRHPPLLPPPLLPPPIGRCCGCARCRCRHSTVAAFAHFSPSPPPCGLWLRIRSGAQSMVQHVHDVERCVGGTTADLHVEDEHRDT
mgnify:CR=1 FL=1